ncbi:hypothetical protein DL764_006789 [Monosporascus ibericus]|uniref:Uncharacterized protein n=1 Tax=Monosporascus ibericus TaxID=155417 RepID=A0A4Q4T3U3_9PEZI|nr:hypothetical protein DL764_006789 [Monosporascus ibericus]
MAQSAVPSASSSSINEPTSLAQKLAEVLSQSDKSILKEVEPLIAAPISRKGAETERERSPGTRSLRTASDAQPSHSHTAVRDLEARDRSRDQQDGPSDGKSAPVPGHSESSGGSHDPDGNTEAGSANKTGDFSGVPGSINLTENEMTPAQTRRVTARTTMVHLETYPHPVANPAPIQAVRVRLGNVVNTSIQAPGGTRTDDFRKVQEEISKRNEELASTNRKVCTKCSDAMNLTGVSLKSSSNYTDGRAFDLPAHGGKRRGARLNGEEAPTPPGREGPGSNVPSHIA